MLLQQLEQLALGLGINLGNNDDLAGGAGVGARLRPSPTGPGLGNPALGGPGVAELTGTGNTPSPPRS